MRQLIKLLCEVTNHHLCRRYRLNVALSLPSKAVVQASDAATTALAARAGLDR